jgi:hypothetical protein
MLKMVTRFVLVRILVGKLYTVMLIEFYFLRLFLFFILSFSKFSVSILFHFVVITNKWPLKFKGVFLLLFFIINPAGGGTPENAESII